jgi:hypothetical protein
MKIKIPKETAARIGRADMRGERPAVGLGSMYRVDVRRARSGPAGGSSGRIPSVSPQSPGTSPWISGSRPFGQGRGDPGSPGDGIMNAGPIGPM